MNTRKIARLAVTFYRYAITPSIIIGLACCYVLWKYGTGTLTGLLWLKMCTMALVVFFTQGYKKKEFYYYRNQGMSVVQLWTIVLLADFLIFILSLIFVNTIR